MFFGDHSKTLTCHAADLVIPRGKGRTNYMPPSVNGIVRRKCIVVAEVQPEAMLTTYHSTSPVLN
jgi:hypothetical protein